MVGASADSDMTTRAGRSLSAAIKYINSKQNWHWLLAEGSPISVIGPFSVAITAGASGVASASAAASHGVKVDDYIVGDGFAAGTRVTATAAAALGFNQAVTGITASNSVSVTATRDFYDLPTDFKHAYSLKLLSSLRTLYPAPRRAYDRSMTVEFSADAPRWYDLFLLYNKGKVRLLPPPNGADTLMIRYFRRMAVPTTTATADVLDIPQDYDFHLMAWAKWHFLVDKAEGRSEQATTWLNLANEGISQMLADQTRVPDESPGFTPGHGTYFTGGPNSTWNVQWDY